MHFISKEQTETATKLIETYITWLPFPGVSQFNIFVLPLDIFWQLVKERRTCQVCIAAVHSNGTLSRDSLECSDWLAGLSFCRLPTYGLFFCGQRYVEYCSTSWRASGSVAMLGWAENWPWGAAVGSASSQGNLCLGCRWCMCYRVPWFAWWNAFY